MATIEEEQQAVAAAAATSENRLTMSCPRALVGRLIGKSGTTVKGVQLFTGVVIEIDQLLDPSRIIILGSSAESVRMAESIVQDIINGKFKGFALLRQLVASQAAADASQATGAAAAAQPSASLATHAEQYVYAPGFGLFPQRQVSLRLGGFSGRAGEIVQQRPIYKLQNARAREREP
jgi:rRNA processing protein Krr1/Pno1